MYKIRGFLSFPISNLAFCLIYICLYILSSTCRTDFIQSALDRTVSWQSNARFPNFFGPFVTSLDDFEVARHVKTRRNSKMDLAFIDVSFRQNGESDFLLR